MAGLGAPELLVLLVIIGIPAAIILTVVLLAKR
jgi:hypothetical protein